MSIAAKKREFLEAAHELVKASDPSPELIVSVCAALGEVLSDMFDEPVVIFPQPVAD